MSNVSKCFSCARKNDYDPKFGYYGCKLSGQECKGYSMFEPKAKPKPITNYDLLIRKTPEELADWLGVFCNGQTAQEVGKPCISGMGSCEECWLDWLKQEVEDNGTAQV